MTDQRDHNGSQHLTDEQLSWYLDGMPDDSGAVAVPASPSAEQDHLAGCDACQARLGVFESTRELVRTPVVPVTSAGRAEAVAAVLRAAPAEPPAGSFPERVDEPVVLPRRLPAITGAAAAVVALLVVLGVGFAVIHNGSASNKASSAARAPATTVPSHTGEGALGAPGVTPGAGKDSQSIYSTARLGGTDETVASLGTTSSVGALRTAVSHALSSFGQASSASSGLSVTTPAPGNETNGGDNAASPATTGPSPAKVPNTAASTPAGESGAFGTCLGPAQRVAGSGRVIQLLATTQYEKTVALVYVFVAGPNISPPQPSARQLVVVMARGTCRHLATTTL